MIEEADFMFWKTSKQYRKKGLRKGQSIFNACFDEFPKETNTLRATEFDCYYDDSKIDIFLDKLYYLIKEGV